VTRIPVSASFSLCSSKISVVLCVVRVMNSQLSPSARRQLDRFCRQYLQVEPDLDYPDPEHLRNDGFQQALYARAFKDGVAPSPPTRYRLRVLKKLTKKIEESIQDWDEEVCRSLLKSSRLPGSSGFKSPSTLF